jgi:hypothetical protein
MQEITTKNFQESIRMVRESEDLKRYQACSDCGKEVTIKSTRA